MDDWRGGRGNQTGRTLRVLGLVLALGIVTTPAIGAQAPRPTRFTIQVADSAGRPVTGVDLSVLQGLHASVAQGTTDDRGTARFSAPLDPGDYDIVARHIGFTREDRFVTVSATDTLVSLSLIIRHAVATLAAVKVTAAEDAKRKSYHTDADEIANSPRRCSMGSTFSRSSSRTCCTHARRVPSEIHA